MSSWDPKEETHVADFLNPLSFMIRAQTRDEPACRHNHTSQDFGARGMIHRADPMFGCLVGQAHDCQLRKTRVVQSSAGITGLAGASFVRPRALVDGAGAAIALGGAAGPSTVAPCSRVPLDAGEIA